jgi:hypothetical protein
MSTSHASHKALLTAAVKSARKFFRATNATYATIALVAIIATSTISTKAIAQADSINIVSTAVPFLRISPDARAGGMGDVAIATSADANASFWNISKVNFAKRRSSVAVNYTPWLKDLGLNDVYLATIAGYRQLDEVQAVTGSLRFFSLGNIQLTDYSGNLLNSVKPSEFAIDAGYTRMLNEKMSVGVVLRYINSRLVVGDVGTGVLYKAGNAVAADVSVFHDGTDEGEGLRWGVVLSNLGTKIGYTNDAKNKDFIPANFGAGVSYTKDLDGSNKITFALDMNKLLVPAAPTATGVYGVDSANLSDYRNGGVVSSWLKSFSDGTGVGKSMQFSVGTEYAYNDQFFVRAGYFYENRNRGNRKYATVGAGFKLDFMDINLSYLVPSGAGITRNPLSNTMRLGVCFKLGE